MDDIPILPYPSPIPVVTEPIDDFWGSPFDEEFRLSDFLEVEPDEALWTNSTYSSHDGSHPEGAQPITPQSVPRQGTASEFANAETRPAPRQNAPSLVYATISSSQSSSSQTRASSLTEAEWQRIFDTVSPSYLEKSLKDLLALLPEATGLSPSRKQLKSKVKLWRDSGLLPRKNMSKDDMDFMVFIRHLRDLEGLPTVFSHYGFPVPEEKLQKHKDRHGIKNQKTDPQDIPKYITWRISAEGEDLSEPTVMKKAAAPGPSDSRHALGDQETIINGGLKAKTECGEIARRDCSAKQTGEVICQDELGSGNWPSFSVSKTQPSCDSDSAFEIELNEVPSTTVGEPEAPYTNGASFTFTREAGSSAKIVQPGQESGSKMQPPGESQTPTITPEQSAARIKAPIRSIPSLYKADTARNNNPRVIRRHDEFPLDDDADNTLLFALHPDGKESRNDQMSKGCVDSVRNDQQTYRLRLRHDQEVLALELQAVMDRTKRGIDPQEWKGEWQGVIALHKSVLDQHAETFLATQNPCDSSDSKGLYRDYSIFWNMWRGQCISITALLRDHLPELKDHVAAFLTHAYEKLSLLHRSVQYSKEVSAEFLGDLAKIGIALDDERPKEHEIWSARAQQWYTLACNLNPSSSRLYHRLSYVSQHNRFLQLFYLCRSLTSSDVDAGARHTILEFFGKPREANDGGRMPVISFVEMHSSVQRDKCEDAYSWLKQFESSLLEPGALPELCAEENVQMAIINITSLFGYGEELDSIYGRRYSWTPMRLIFETGYYLSSHLHSASTTSDYILSSLKARLPNEYQAGFLSARQWQKWKYKMLSEAFEVVVSSQTADRVLPHIHVLMAFLVALLEAKRLIEEKLTMPVVGIAAMMNCVPWRTLCLYLNGTPFHETPKDFIISFPPSPGGPLPEDFLLRGLVWTKDYFPSNWFDITTRNAQIGDYVPRQKLRIDRILWLAHRLCSLGVMSFTSGMFRPTISTLEAPDGMLSSRELEYGHAFIPPFGVAQKSFSFSTSDGNTAAETSIPSMETSIPARSPPSLHSPQETPKQSSIVEMSRRLATPKTRRRGQQAVQKAGM